MTYHEDKTALITKGNTVAEVQIFDPDGFILERYLEYRGIEDHIQLLEEKGIEVTVRQR